MTPSNENIFRVTGPGEFRAQRPVARSFDVFFDLHLNKRLSKQSWGWWFATLSRPLWRRCNEVLVQTQGLYSLSGRMPYSKISCSPDAARFGFKFFNQCCCDACPVSVRYDSYYIQSRGFAGSYGKTAGRLMNWGPDFVVPVYSITSGNKAAPKTRLTKQNWDRLLDRASLELNELNGVRMYKLGSCIVV